MSKQPSFQFYPGDWMKDPDLRRCSLFARGLLADLLCVCFESATRGKLCERDGLTPWSDDDILSAAGSQNDLGRQALAELLAKGVLSRDANGCVFSRRMIRDEELRKIRADAGHLGGKQNRSKTEAKQEAKTEQTHEQNGPPSSSSSSSTSVKKKRASPADARAIEIPESLKTDQFKASWELWIAHRSELKKPLTLKGWELALKELVPMGPVMASKAIEHSIANGYQGIYEPRSNGTPHVNGQRKSTVPPIGAPKYQ